MKKIRRFWLNLTTCRAPSDHWDSYAHWYCQKRRWHGRQTPAKGLVSSAHVHRFNNYTWRDGEKPDYEPIPFDIGYRGARMALTPRKSPLLVPRWRTTSTCHPLHRTGDNQVSDEEWQNEPTCLDCGDALDAHCPICDGCLRPGPGECTCDPEYS